MSGTHDQSAQSGTPTDHGSMTVIPLNVMTRSLGAVTAAGAVVDTLHGAGSSRDGVPCFVLLDDAWRGTSHLQDLFESMQRPLYGVTFPQVCKPLLPHLLMLCTPCCIL